MVYFYNIKLKQTTKTRDMKAITLNELLQGPANNPARKALYEFLFQKGYPADVIATCTSFELRWMAKH